MVAKFPAQGALADPPSPVLQSLATALDGVEDDVESDPDTFQDFYLFAFQFCLTVRWPLAITSVRLGTCPCHAILSKRGNSGLANAHLTKHGNFGLINTYLSKCGIIGLTNAPVLKICYCCCWW